MDTGERPAKRLRSVVITPAAKQALADAETAPEGVQYAAASAGQERSPAPGAGGAKQPQRSAWREKWERRRAAELAENAPPAANGVPASAQNGGKDPDAQEHRAQRSRSPSAGRRRSEGCEARPRRRPRPLAVPVALGGTQGVERGVDQGPRPRSPAGLAAVPAVVEGGAGQGAADAAGAPDAGVDAPAAPAGASTPADSPDAGPAKKRSRWEAAAVEAAGPGTPVDAGGGISAALLSSPEVPSPLAMAAALAAAQEDARPGAANSLPPPPPQCGPSHAGALGSLASAEPPAAAADDDREPTPVERLPPPPPVVADGERRARPGAGLGSGSAMRALDQEVLEFARAVAPDRSEAAVREAAFQRVAFACRAAHMPNVQVPPSMCSCGLPVRTKRAYQGLSASSCSGHLAVHGWLWDASEEAPAHAVDAEPGILHPYADVACNDKYQARARARAGLWQPGVRAGAVEL